MVIHQVVLLLWSLSLLPWCVLWYWFLFQIILKRGLAPWVGFLAALFCVALAVASYMVFAQWLEEPSYARIAACAYGGPAAFFIIVAAAGWFSPRSLDCYRSCEQAAVGCEKENESGEQGGGKKMV